jgi:hypothetical protein
MSERQMEVLESFVASRTASVRLVQRAQIILLAFQKKNNEVIGEIVALNPQQVSVWRKRWKAKLEHLIHVECTDTKAALQRAIENVLSDLPRKGRGSKFTTEQQAAIVAIACEDPDDKSERPISHWTNQEIADEAVQREIVPTISASRVRDFLKSGRPEAAPQQVLAVQQTGRPGCLERASHRGVPGLSRGRQAASGDRSADGIDR